MTNHRIGSALVGIGFVGSATASLLGTAPSWPSPVVWAVLGFLAALSALWFAAFPSTTSLQLMTVLIVVAAGARGLGYLINAPSTATRLAVGGAWMIVVGMALSFHTTKRGAV